MRKLLPILLIPVAIASPCLRDASAQQNGIQTYPQNQSGYGQQQQAQQRYAQPQGASSQNSGNYDPRNAYRQRYFRQAQQYSQAQRYAAPSSYNQAAQPRSAQQQAHKAYDFADTVTSSGMRRTYRVHIPASYDRSKPIPVVMVFHGLGGNGALMKALTQFDIYADKKNFVVIYPDGLGSRWDDGPRTNNGDVQFVSDLLAKLSTAINIDRRHISAVGYSNGGHFVMYLACVTNWLNSIGVVAAAMMDAAANQCGSGRTPAMFFVGTADPLVPSDDAQHNATLGKLGDAVGLSGLGSLSVPMAKLGGVMSAEETVEFWAKKNGSSTSPYTSQMPDTNSHDGTNVVRETFGGLGSEVVYYKIQNGGHTWPGAIYNGPGDIVGKVSQDIDATELLTDFFLKH